MSVNIYIPSKDKVEAERVCAEGFMRFLYDTSLGAPLLFCIFKRAIFSRICGLWADSKFSKRAVAKFVKQNDVDMGDSLNAVSSFNTFNEFFTRKLKDNSRPFENTAENAISFPSDGRHLLVRNVSTSNVFYAKQSKFNLQKFFGSAELAARFEGGDMLISRLSPLDYHRFHYPISGTIVARRLIGGFLYSVSPIALARNLAIFWRNKRVFNCIESSAFGVCAFVEIGATNVGTIVNFANIGDTVKRGDEAGMFRFGASCVITMFEKSKKIKWSDNLLKAAEQGVECYARVNQTAGVLVDK